MDNIISRIYHDITNPAGYSSAQKLYTTAKKENSSITRQQVKEWLSSQNTYTLHKPRRVNFPRSRTIVTDKNIQWQADLADLKMFSSSNKHNKYLLTVVDVFSRFAYVQSLQNKTGPEVAKAFERIFKQASPTSIQTDNGKEFLNKEVKNLFKQYNINFFTTTDEDTKCSLVERFNRTLKDKMFKIMTKTGTRKYVDVLDAIVKSYNNSVHSATGYKPVDVNINNRDDIFERLYGFKDKREMLLQRVASEKDGKLQKGDQVRIRKEDVVFTRGYHPHWTEEVFTIVGVVNDNPRYYFIKDEDGELIKGRFYEQELQKVTTPTFRVERIIKTRIRNGKKECYIKWLNFPSTRNSWIPESDIVPT